MAVSGPLIVGVLNTTPDSFSDGGRFPDSSMAIAEGIRLHAQGAHIIDVGGESTRPGATRISGDEECGRVIPVINGLVAAGIPVSIDTMRASTACAAVEHGACLVNDVSGGLADPAMLPAVAELGVPIILMHWRAHSHEMQNWASYDDVVSEVVAGIGARVDAAQAAGITRDRIIIDPGLGFAKEADHNWALLQGLDSLTELGFPVLVGASRKRFLGALLADEAGNPREPRERDGASAVISALAAEHGAWAVRVHDVPSTRDALLVQRAWAKGSAS
ncbi:MAG: dihydropteroate synthase [Actinomycetota bacterium]|jgi:dihydropteroate synthase